AREERRVQLLVLRGTLHGVPLLLAAGREQDERECGPHQRTGRREIHGTSSARRHGHRCCWLFSVILINDMPVRHFTVYTTGGTHVALRKTRSAHTGRTCGCAARSRAHHVTITS